MDIDVADDGFWRGISINSTNNTVCSYNFKNPNATSNVFEIKIQKAANTMIAVYYYSSLIDKIIDLGIFSPESCSSVKHCVKSDKGYIMFVLD